MAIAVVSRVKQPTPAPAKAAHKKAVQRPHLARTHYGSAGLGFGLLDTARATPAVIQAKLEVGSPDDKFEQEADRVADEVMRMPEAASSDVTSWWDNPASRSPTRIQRLCTECEAEEERLQRIRRKPVADEEEVARMKPLVGVAQRQTGEEGKEFLQAKAGANGGPDMSTGIEGGNQSARGGGQPLSSPLRAFFEPRFGHDFTPVRIHTDARATASAHAVNARAYTVGHDIVFGVGQYAPGTRECRQLLAHELTHVIQQNGIAAKGIQRKLGDHHDLLAERFQGRSGLEATYDDESVIENGDSGPDIVALQLALIDAGYPMPRFGADGRFGPETEDAMRNFQGDHGLRPDGVVGSLTMEVLDGLFTVGPVVEPHCSNPGVARTLKLQPVVFKCGNDDNDPTGGSFFRQLTEANRIWSKLGTTFTAGSPVVKDDCENKTKGGTDEERLEVGSLHTGGGVRIFFVDNAIADLGGGWTRYSDNKEDGYVIMSDLGTSITLLAHELGHVLGLGHPPDFAESKTIMDPVGSHSVAHSDKNTMYNYALLTIFFRETDDMDRVCLTPDSTAVRF